MAAFGFVVGAFFGSFLNMVIYRLPRRISFLKPSHSICPNCKHPLAGKDLVPILSWLSTKGKCRYCGDPISSRYMFVEILTGLVFFAIWYRLVALQLNPSWGLLVAQWAFALGLVAIIFIDWELYIIPDELNGYLLVVAMLFHAFAGSLGTAFVGWLAGWGALWGIAFFGRIAFGKDAMGHGDIKMMRAVGAFLGPALLFANLMIAVVLGLVVGIVGIALASRKKAAVAQEEAEGEFFPPESIGSLLKLGVWYLLALDVVAIFFPKMYRWIGETQEEVAIEDDPWTPSLTTIPFGPYLAAGALVCLMFGEPILAGMQAYWDRTTGVERTVPGLPNGPVSPRV